MVSSITHQVVMKIAGNGTQSINGPTVTGTTGQSLVPTIPASTTNQQVEAAFVVSQLLSIIITVTGTVTMLTNSTGSPGNTFTITAAGAFVWQAGSGQACPFTTSTVTTLYFTNSGASSVQVTIQILTP